MDAYSGEPLDMTRSNGPWENNGKTVPKSTKSSENGTMTTTNWPRNATDRTELHHDQTEVIRTAAQNPDIDNIAKINRMCNYREDRTSTYANMVLNSHWPERTSDEFNPDVMDTTSENSSESNEDGKLQMETTLGTEEVDNEETERETVESESGGSETADWPDGVTPREELSSDQIAVIETAMENPTVTNTGKLTRLSDISDDRNDYYAFDVLDAHWEERLREDGDEDKLPRETVEGVTPPDDFDAFPSELGSKDEYNDAQVQLVQTVMLNPDIDVTTDITRLAGLAVDYDVSYGSTFFYTHWEDWKEYDPADDGIDPSDYRSDSDADTSSDEVAVQYGVHDTSNKSQTKDEEVTETGEVEHDSSVEWERDGETGHNEETTDSNSEDDTLDVGKHSGGSGEERTSGGVVTDDGSSSYWIVVAIISVGYIVYRALRNDTSDKSRNED